MTQKQLNISKICKQQKHSFHIVGSSPWPFLTFASLLNLAICAVLIFNYDIVLDFWPGFGVIYTILTGSIWFYEYTPKLGIYTLKAQHNFRYSFGIFLVSEVILFFVFFWCYFYISLSPSIWIGCTWPVKNIISSSLLYLPLLKVILLLFSSVFLVFAHKSTMKINGRKVLMSLAYTISLGVVFLVVLVYEYYIIEFSTNDGIFGSIFYISTSFHGIHATVGIVSLFIYLLRYYLHRFSRDHHIGLELTFWYWHFIDFTWLLLYLIIYTDSFDLDIGCYNIKISEYIHTLLLFLKNEKIVFIIVFNFFFICWILYFFGYTLGKRKSLFLSYINVVLSVFLMAGFFFSFFFNSNFSDYSISWKLEFPYNYCIEVIIWKINSLELLFTLIFHFYWHLFFIVVQDCCDLQNFLFRINFFVLYAFLCNIIQNRFLLAVIGFLIYAVDSGLYEALLSDLKEKIKTLKFYINSFLNKWFF